MSKKRHLKTSSLEFRPMVFLILDPVNHPSIHPLILCTAYSTGMYTWRLSQETPGTRQCTGWTGFQSITGHNSTHTCTKMTICTQRISVDWRRKYMQTPHHVAEVGIEPTALKLWGKHANVHFCKASWKRKEKTSSVVRHLSGKWKETE